MHRIFILIANAQMPPLNEPRVEISKYVVCATSKGSDHPAHTCCLIRTFASCYSLTVELLAEHHLEFLSFKGGCTSSPESIHVKMPHCCKSHVIAQMSKLTCPAWQEVLFWSKPSSISIQYTFFKFLLWWGS